MSIGFLQTKIASDLPSREDRLSLFAGARDSITSEIDEIAGSWLDRDPAVLADLPTTSELLTHGGDGRIACGSRGSNRYGCSAFPEPDLLAFGSCTASTISPAGFKAADALRRRLRDAASFEPAPVTYDRELGRLRRELGALCGLESVRGLEIIFAASGTDLHLFASQLMVDSCAPAPLIIRVEAAETGRGVPDALAGHHFSDSSALGDSVVPNSPLDCGRSVEILEVKCRSTDGTLRAAATVDQEVEAATRKAVEAGRRVLITLVDVSKTGLLAPSPACASALRQRFPDRVEVFVDACQFRLAPSTLKAYLDHDFLVAVTGSKFLTGPTFCGALFVPQKSARRLKTRTFPHALRSYSTRADWPRDWAARTSLRNVENYGLLLRWRPRSRNCARFANCLTKRFGISWKSSPRPSLIMSPTARFSNSSPHRHRIAARSRRRKAGTIFPRFSRSCCRAALPAENGFG
jgi:hypothetical protein